MAREVIEPEAFESGSTLLEVLKAEDYSGESHAGAAFEKLNLDLRVISYVEQEDDDGEFIGTEFTDGAYYKEGRSGAFGIPLRGKLPELLKAMKGEDYFTGIRSGRIQFDPDDLVGSRFRATVEMNDDGYSKILWNTIKPAKKKVAQKEQKALEDEVANDMAEAETKSKPKAKSTSGKSKKDAKAPTMKDKQKAAEEAAAAKSDEEVDEEADDVLGKAS